MFSEETFNDLKADPELSNGGSWVSDAMIRSREFILNRLSGVRPSLVLNRSAYEITMSPPADLAGRLKQTLDDLKLSAIDAGGTEVDYAVLRESQDYADYQAECLAALQYFEPNSLPTESARRAFWINLYNALVLDAVIAFGLENSVTEGWLGTLTFFRRAAYRVDGQRVSLEDIEHGILRANRGNPYVPGPHFPSGDPRLAWSLPLDPRLHFALNCGGRSCPPIRSYASDRLDVQLDLAARGFIDASVDVRPQENELWVSRILQWYQRDFGGRDGVLDFLVRYLPEDERRDYLKESGDSVLIRYQAYDWALNRA